MHPGYADDIVLLAKSEQASERLLRAVQKYLEGTLKLKVNGGEKPYGQCVCNTKF